VEHSTNHSKGGVGRIVVKLEWNFKKLKETSEVGICGSQGWAGPCRIDDAKRQKCLFSGAAGSGRVISDPGASGLAVRRLRVLQGMTRYHCLLILLINHGIPTEVWPISRFSDGTPGQNGQSYQACNETKCATHTGSHNKIIIPFGVMACLPKSVAFLRESLTPGW
jgi:hypothetical protein